MYRRFARVGGAVSYIVATPSRIVASSFAIACVAAVTEFFVLAFLAYLKISLLSMRIENSIVTGIVTGGFVWALLVMVSLRRQYVRTKLQVVADLNHHLRNALEVILLSEYLPNDERHAALIESAERIDKALAELLAEARSTG